MKPTIGRGAFGDGQTLVGHILALQRSVGNRAVTEMLGAMIRQESRLASAIDAAEPREPPGEEAAPAEEAEPAAVPASRSADERVSSWFPEVVHLEHGTTQNEERAPERSEQVPQQEEQPRVQGPSYGRVLVLAKVGLSIILVALVLAAVLEPEPRSKLTLAGLFAGMIAVILLRFRRDRGVKLPST